MAAEKKKATEKKKAIDLKNISWVKAALIALIAVICIIMGYLAFTVIRKTYVRFAVRSSAYGETYDTITDCVKNGIPVSEDGTGSTAFGSIYVYDPYNTLDESGEAAENETEAETESETEQDVIAGTAVTSSLDEIGYYFKDINKDGVKDFLIGVQDEDNKITRIYEVYTLDEEQNVKHIYSAYGSAYLMLTTDGYFVGSISDEDIVTEETEAETEAEIVFDEDGNLVDQTLENGYYVKDGKICFDEDAAEKLMEESVIKLESESAEESESESAKASESESAKASESESAKAEASETESASADASESAEAESTESDEIIVWNLTAKGFEEVKLSGDVKLRELHLYTFE